jgi:hypothetical protein
MLIRRPYENNGKLFKKYCCSLSLCMVVLPSLAMGEEFPWKAGTARSAITPEEKVWLSC